MLFKPLDSLQEGILLRVLGYFVIQGRTNSESVLHTTVEVDLIWLACLLQDLLRFVPLLCWEDGVGLSSANGEWALDLLQFLRLYKARMRTISHLDLPLVRLQMSNNILGSEAVAYSANSFAPQLLPHLHQRCFDDGVNRGGLVTFEPLHEIKVLSFVQWHRITVENIGHHDEVAICCKLVGDELSVDEAVTDHVRKPEACSESVPSIKGIDIGSWLPCEVPDSAMLTVR